MNEIWERVDVSDVVARLEAGESPARVAESFALSATDLIAAVAHEALADPDRLPLVQSSPRRPRLLAALSEAAWAPLLVGSSRPARLALMAALLQMHDFWVPSHEAAQQADDLGERSVSRYWHGIAHRREPDPGNAAYWFRRVGRHPVFASLATAATPVLQAHGDSALAAKLLPNGSWNPFAFIDLCTQGRPDTPTARLARALQRLEMIALLEPTMKGISLG